MRFEPDLPGSYFSALIRAWLPSPDQSSNVGSVPGANVVIGYRLPCGSTRYSVEIAVSRVGSFGTGSLPGPTGVIGFHTASIQPCPTFDHGTLLSAASTPC